MAMVISEHIDDVLLHAASDGAVEWPLEDLNLGRTSVRTSVREAHVRLLAQVHESWPPILVSRQSHEIVDGVHRYHAAVLLGRRTISCTFFEGETDEAFLEAVQRNITHGLPLTLVEREAAALKILEVRWAWSDRKVARLCGLAPTTIGRLRNRPSARSGHSNIREGIDGRSRPIDKGALRERIETEIRAMPAGSLREIANLVGASPSTVKSVRDRLRDTEAESEEAWANAHPTLGDSSAASGLTITHRSAVSMLGTPEPGLSAMATRKNWTTDNALSATSAATAFSEWFARTEIDDDWNIHVGVVPLSRCYEVADEARRRARSWSAFAEMLEQRTRSR